MLKIIIKAVDYFLRPQEHETIDFVFRARAIIVMASLFIILTALISILAVIQYGLELQRLIGPGVIAIYIYSLFHLRKTRTLYSSGIILMTGACLANVVWILATGGLNSFALPVMACVPFTAGFLFGTRTTVLTTSIMMVFVWILFGLHDPIPGAEDTALMIALILSVTLIAIASVSISFSELSNMKSKELEEARSTAERASRVKTDFVANMSHEIRTPLNGILGMAQLLSLRDLPKEEKAYVKVITNSGQSLLALINNILDISRIESGLVDVTEESFDIEVFLKQVMDSGAGSAIAKGLRLDLDIGVSGIFNGDVAHIRQILINLLGNAVKFTETGSITLRCRSLEDDWLRFEIEDTGPGIPREQHALIFERFQQVDGNSDARQTGSGLGLSISKELASVLGGRIGLRSEPDQGSCFWVELPLERISSAKSSPAIPANIVSTETPHTDHPATILLAEDHPINLMFFAKMFTSLGHCVHTVENGQQALDRLTEEQFDLLVIDQEMPVLNGAETIRRIRSSDMPQAGIPIIALTAHALSEVEAELRDAGANAYFSKPFNTVALSRKIDELVRIASSAQR